MGFLNEVHNAERQLYISGCSYFYFAAIELCDGTPSQVEGNLDYWVDTVQRFCHWSAQIVKIEDYR